MSGSTMDPAEYMMEPGDFIDPGADDDERVKGIKQGHLRQWADMLDALENELREVKETLRIECGR